MTQVDFYILPSADPSARLDFACKLTEKAWRMGHRIYLHCSDAAQRDDLDAHRRTRRYARMLEFFTGRDDAQPSVERTVIAQSTLQAFDQLNTEQRALLLWVSVEGLSYKEVAAILEVPVGTVMSRLSRARQALRQLSDGEIASPSLRILK